MGPYATDRDQLLFIIGAFLMGLAICIGVVLAVAR